MGQKTMWYILTFRLKEQLTEKTALYNSSKAVDNDESQAELNQKVEQLNEKLNWFVVEPNNLEGMARFAYISQKHNIDSQVKGFEDKTGVKLHPTDTPTDRKITVGT